MEPHIHVITLAVADIERATRFYRDGLGLPIRDVTETLSESEFRVFRETAASGGTIRGIRGPGAGSLSRKEITLLEEVSRENGGQGLLWLKVKEGGELSGPAAKFLGETPEVSRQDGRCDDRGQARSFSIPRRLQWILSKAAAKKPSVSWT